LNLFAFSRLWGIPPYLLLQLQEFAETFLHLFAYLLYTILNRNYASSKKLKIIFDKLLHRSPYLESINGFEAFSANGSKLVLDFNVIELLAQFQHLKF